MDGNDGIMATAGIVEGFIGAGAATETILVAAIAAMVAGAIAMGSAKYAEAAIERDATNALIAEERRQLTCRRRRSSPSWPRSTSAAGSRRSSHARSRSS